MSSRLAPSIVDAATLADELVRFRVVDSLQLDALLAEFPGGDALALSEFLVTRKVLTPFQGTRALAGESRLLRLGPYHLTGRAGCGIFGPMFTAVRKDRPGTFCLQPFPLRSLWQARHAKQLARSLALLNHPAVVPLVDADSANGVHFLVWPQAEGQPLTERLVQRGLLPPGEAVGVLAHLADALHVCHTRQLSHGALTPQSILLDCDGMPRVVGFGIGAVLAANVGAGESMLDTLSAAVAIASVLRFAGPEFAADPTPTAAADQYSLGAIGYLMLSGQPPFPTLALTSQVAAKQAETPTSLRLVNPAVPLELAAIIDRMLQPIPVDRFPGLDEVHERLGNLSLLPEPSGTRPVAIAVDSLPLSALADPMRQSGTVPWTAVERSRSGMVSFSGYDDSDASISFELPEAVEEMPVDQKSPQLRSMETPPRGVLETDSVSPVIASSPAALSSPSSPAQHPEGSIMAKHPFPDPIAARGLRTPQPSTSDALATPVQWHTEESADPSGLHPGVLAATPAPMGEEPPPEGSVLWRKLKRNLLFWQSAIDVLQVSVFGPAAVLPGQPAKLSVYLHTPESADSVRTLSRAFHHDSELLGSGYASREVARQTTLAVHLAVTNAGVSRSLVNFVWRGQPQRVVFELHVPWESPAGPAPGLVSVGRDNVRIGKIDFRLTLLPRKV